MLKKTSNVPTIFVMDINVVKNPSAIKISPMPTIKNKIETLLRMAMDLLDAKNHLK